MGIDRSPTKSRSKGVIPDTGPKPMPSGAFGKTYSLKDNLKEGEGVCGGFGCGKKVGERQSGVQCDACLRWFHSGCGGLSKKDYENIKSMTDSTLWVCGNCEEFVRGARDRWNKLEEENRYLRKLNEELKAEMGKFFKEEIRKVKMEIKDEVKSEVLAEIKGEFGEKCEGGEGTSFADKVRMSTGEGKKEEIMKEIKNEVLSEVKEDEERKKRECNFVVYGLVEGGDGDDRGKLKEIIEGKLGIKDAHIAEVTRLRGGKGRLEENNNNNGGVVPTLVKMETVGQKWAVIGKAKNLRAMGDRFRRVMIMPDLTKNERIRDKKIREEMWRRRGEGEKVFIRRGKIVKRENVKQREELKGEEKRED